MTRVPRVSRELANEIFDVLVEECGAREESSGHGREAFVHWLSGEHYGNEFRFMGALGWGGKFWIEDGLTPRFSVSNYREDETPERLRMMAAANRRLAEMGRE
jgi:hypothetical protein